MSDKHPCPCTDTCPLQQALDCVGGKWKLPILCALSSDDAKDPSAPASHRYNDLLKKVNGISNTMLAKSLKELERDGLISREEFLEIPIRVEYRLTDRARTLQPILADLAMWQLGSSAETTKTGPC